jgi:broad specificity phosphatase PhoE
MRHAESISNAKGIFQGQSVDLGLSELGKKQAIALADKLSTQNVDTIIASPLRRTIETANPLAESLDEQITKDNLIIETNHGEWEGHDKNWIEENFKEQYELWHNAPSLISFPGGERFEDTITRAKAFLDNHRFVVDTAIFTHDNIVRTILSLILGKPIDKMWEFNIEPAAITTISYNPTFRVEVIGDTSHLGGIHSDLQTHAL